MFNFEETLAAKALEEQQLRDHESDFGDRSPLLGGTAQTLSSFEVSNRQVCLSFFAPGNLTPFTCPHSWQPADFSDVHYVCVMRAAQLHHVYANTQPILLQASCRLILAF